MKIVTYETSGGTIGDGFKEYLSKILSSASPPIGLDIEQADSRFAGILRNWNGSDCLELALTEHFHDTSSIRVLISAGGSEKFITYCLSRAAHAEWGKRRYVFWCVG